MILSKLQQFQRFLLRHSLATAVGSLWFLAGSWFYVHALQQKESGWYLGHGNVWSDWSLHLSQITRFAFTDPQYWWSSTYFAGAKFTYPFMSNLFSGILIRVGWSYQAAMILPSLAFWAMTLLVLLWFGTWVLQSSKQAALAITLFFCSAGIGLVRIFEQEEWLAELIDLSRDYTQFTQYEWGTGNLFLGMFLPQRAFLLGFWVALLAWGLWVKTLEHKDIRTIWWKVVLAGVMAGCLPIIHMHSFLVIVMLSLPLAVAFYDQRWKQIVLFAVTAGSVSIPLYILFVAGGIENEFFQFRPGWTASGPFDWVRQWIWQWGVMIPLAALGVWHVRSRAKVLQWVTLASFWFVFFVANVIQFQPVAWDNTKIFLWVYWGFSLSAASLLAYLWRKGTHFRIVAVTLALILTVTGAAELLRSSNLQEHTYLATSQESYELAREIRQSTAPDAVFATAPIHNHWVTMWAGRSIVMGYSTWVWNFGYDFKERQTDLETLFLDASQRERLVQKYGIDFVVFGPDEQAVFPRDIFRDQPIFASSNNTQVYDVRGWRAPTE